MIAGLPLAFTAPFILLGLIALPLLWWLLRLVPPRPRRVAFPPTRILFEIEPKEETPARTPWWLTLLRLLLAALIIIAAAGPLWNPPPAGSRAGGPVALVIDSGWPAAAQWESRMAAAEAIVARAEADGVGIAVLASGAPPKETSLLRPGEAREALRLLAPVPHTPDRNELLLPLGRLLAAAPAVSVVWLSDGADLGDGEKFATALNQLAPGRVSVVSGGIPGAVALTAADNAAAGLSVKVLRAEDSAPAQGVVRARDLRGLPLGDANFMFEAGATETDARFDLPVEIRNDIARLEIAGERSAGAVTLLDKRWRRRTVGVVSGSTVDTAQPLLAGTFYLSRALGPFADVSLAEGTAPAGAVERFIDQRLPVIVLSDVGNIAETARNRLVRWIEEGGVLVRFAGPRLAAADDNLVPVRLRRGGRTLGGSLSWEQPQKLGSFSADGPFSDLTVPGDVVVQRQVLAEPDGLLAERTWASLADGTPLVTATRRERGMIVLFHVTADTAWSNLPISGSFVDMLRRIVALAGSGTAAASGTPSTQAERGPAPTIAPSRLLDGFGAFTAPGPTAKPIPADFTGRAVVDHPPGFYGPPEGLVAVNTLAPDDRMAPLALGPLQTSVEPYHQGEAIDLRPGFLLGVFSLLALDAIIVFLLAGGLSRLTRRRATAATLALAVALSALADHRVARAQELTQAQTDFALQATLQTRFAYVRTGNAEADTLSQAGLEGLSIFMAQRTALETAEPMGVDISRDELSFFPILYWPVLPSSPVPDAATLARVDTYMKQGGTILFDTRDEFASGTGRANEVTPSLARLRQILSGLDIPELEPVPRDHVLTKSFYLLRDFPGRFTGGTLWVEALPAATEEQEARPARAGDGVSQILITSNDFAGAWAVGRDGQPLLPLVPGEPRQREFAFRVGVNIVMYVLTGNYKADQVHVPALLERLGQ
ncbi:MAG TPA: DUF4159 domain-containing protein [Xanthobacteraceae bacterium]|nr:DUF4159 domain-containing protein [Xanthobacteraceae bacterium]